MHRAGIWFFTPQTTPHTDSEAEEALSESGSLDTGEVAARRNPVWQTHDMFYSE